MICLFDSIFNAFEKHFTGPDDMDVLDLREYVMGLIENTRTPAPAEVEDLLDHIISAANSVSIPSESNYLNDLKSRLLVALSNTTPYLSQDVIVPVEKLEAGKEYDMTVRVRIESDVAKMETKPCLWVVIDGDSRKLEAWLRHAKPTFRKVGE